MIAGPVELIVMRLINMKRVHPEQITARCSLCNEVVAVYPSGQRAMREHPNLKLVCEVCKEGRSYTELHLAPGAKEERQQSVSVASDDKPVDDLIDDLQRTIENAEPPGVNVTYIGEDGEDKTVHMWTIYMRKEGGYLALCWEIGGGTAEPTLTGVGIESEHLHPLREVMALKGLTPLARNEEDAFEIVETWV